MRFSFRRPLVILFLLFLAVGIQHADGKVVKVGEIPPEEITLQSGGGDVTLAQGFELLNVNKKRAQEFIDNIENIQPGDTFAFCRGMGYKTWYGPFYSNRETARIFIGYHTIIYAHVQEQIVEEKDVSASVSVVTVDSSVDSLNVTVYREIVSSQATFSFEKLYELLVEAGYDPDLTVAGFVEALIEEGLITEAEGEALFQKIEEAGFFRSDLFKNTFAKLNEMGIFLKVTVGNLYRFLQRYGLSIELVAMELKRIFDQMGLSWDVAIAQFKSFLEKIGVEDLRSEKIVEKEEVGWEAGRESKAVQAEQEERSGAIEEALLQQGLQTEISAGLPHLLIKKTVDNKASHVGETLTYTLGLANLGGLEVSEVLLVEVVPGDLVLKEYKESDGDRMESFKVKDRDGNTCIIWRIYEKLEPQYQSDTQKIDYSVDFKIFNKGISGEQTH